MAGTAQRQPRRADARADLRCLPPERRCRGRRPPRRGRAVALTGQSGLSLGVDIGGTKTFALALDAEGVPLASARGGTATGSVGEFVAAAVAVVRTVTDELG